MAVETEQDRLDILSDFGIIAEVAGVEVLGILDREFKDIGGIESYYPIFECRRSDAPTVAHGDTVKADGKDFHVVSVENDREGMQQLILAVGKSSKYIKARGGNLDAYTPAIAERYRK